MGYELNRLMKQYGVSTPTLGAPQLAPTIPTETADAAAMDAYQKNLANFMANQNYRTQYQDRMAGTPMYAAAQFQPNQQPINTWAAPLTAPVPTTTVPQPATIQDFYSTYLGRQPDAEGLKYWSEQFGPELDQAERMTMLQAAQPELLQRYPQMALPAPAAAASAAPTNTPAAPTADQYAELQRQIEELRAAQQPRYDYGGNARGGYIKKNYANGGEVGELEDMPVPTSPLAAVAEQTAPAPATAAPQPVAAPAPDRSMALQAMMAQYGPQSGGYTREVAAARERHRAETDAFNKLIETHLNAPEDSQHSKAEMYFRLAAAFGAPTRTGQFTEHLGLAGRELAEHSKGRRESAAKKRDLMLSAQQLKMGAAKEDLATVRALEAESMKDRRAIAQEMIKEYIASGKPQSEAGRRAKDMGLTPGTPEYQKKVEEYAQMDLQNKMNQINAQISALSTAQENLKLRQEAAGRLSPTELKMKDETEDAVANGQQALKDISEAYRLNPNTFAGGFVERAQRAALEAAGSNDPKVVNTRVMENLLGAQSLSKLRLTFGGNPTEGERAILMELEGIGAKTREERAEILKRAYTVLQERVAREQRRLDDIRSGAYRRIEPLSGGER